jgi:anti-sigma factor RsiW
MNRDIEISPEELHAFIDGELDPVRTAEIAQLVAANPDLARRIQAFRSDKERLGQVYGTLDELPLPPNLLQLVEDRTAWQPPSFLGVHMSRRGVAGLAAAPLLMLGIFVAYQRLASPDTDTIIPEAFAARQDTMRPEQAFAASTVSTPEARNQILTMALAMMVKTPDLMKLGYALASIRVYSGVPGGRSVELSYRNAQNRLFTLYLRHPSGPARVDLDQRDSMRVCIWQDDVLGMVMLGEMSAAEMARIASLAYSGLTL